jgi:hypothetical protein
MSCLVARAVLVGESNLKRAAGSGTLPVPSQEAAARRSAHRRFQARRGTARSRRRITGDPAYSDHPSTVGLAGLDDAGADTALQSQLEDGIYAPIYGPNHHRQAAATSDAMMKSL